MRPKNLKEANTALDEMTNKLWNCSAIANVIKEELNNGTNLDRIDLCNLSCSLSETLNSLRLESGEIRYSLFGDD